MSPLSRLAGVLALVLVPAAALAQSVAVLPLPADWYPESLAVAADGSFLVGSWRQGAVARVRPDGAAPEVLVPPGSQGMANAQGVLVDAARGTLWVCSGDIGFTVVPSTPSALLRFDLATGAPRGRLPLPDDGYCNDLAQDAHGDLYVTDSRHPRVLRLPAGGAALAVWKDDPLLGGAPVFRDSHGAYVGLNGIAVAPSGDVIVSLVDASPALLRIARTGDGRAGAVARLVAPRRLDNVDALRALPDGRLVLFESNAFGTGPYGGRITLARIDGDRLALRTLVAGLNDPSSGVVSGGRVWFIESKYGLLTHRKPGDGPIPTGVPFDLQSVPLPADS
jgi:sugar lactone lactonase YvrE